MPAPDVPLTPLEERAWRAFAKALITVPRALDADLQREQSMSMAEYSVLMILSEAPGRAQRMSEIAAACGLSPSRITRVVDALASDGLVERRRCDTDGRGQIAVLTDAGFSRLESAYPSHLRSVRRHVMDQLADLDLDEFARAAATFASACARVADTAGRS